ncbi:hypothetical protein KC19_4G148100 [Ceratodon purpureus]|uniref:DNA helicase n=1 Tax=Ceratodon purpureus TaxID=3225 RepID=A0A8T0I8R0_CERPU|nr:hypothetical protein KC19_4G148100 [Ceratodon purpureus]
MQQTSSKQLKCYGRRNRARPEPTSLESGLAEARDVSGATVSEEAVPVPVTAATATSVQVGVVAQAKAPQQHAGRGRPRKVVGAPKPGEKAPGDVASKKVPATRSSVGRPGAPDAREAARDPTPVEESGAEGPSLKVAGQAQVQDRVPVRVRIVGPFSNGGSKHGRGKSFGSASPGSQKTRGQIARQEAQRAAGVEVGDGAPGAVGRSEAQAGPVGSGRGMEGNAGAERRDAGQQVTGAGPDVGERGVGAKQPRERREAGHGAIGEMDARQGAIEARVGAMSHREGSDAAEQAVDRSEEGLHPVIEKRVGGKSQRERTDAGAEAVGRRDGAQSIAEKRVGGKSHRERRDGGNAGQDREALAAAQSTLASRRRLLALQKRQREDAVLAKADEVVLKHEYLEANRDKRGLPKSKEPARHKTHWDFVLEEMAWLAKDFERERKWKLSQAKKVALRVNRSKLDVVAKENRRLKEEEQRMRRVASNIAKDVKKFWLKVDKLVSYKQQLLVEERKKKALDKHLDFLLGQTERYSTMLAENLADVIPAHEPQSVVPLSLVGKDGSGGDGRVPGAASEPVDGGKGDELEGAVRMEIEGDGDGDFTVEDEAEQEDDEGTLEADEALITEEERKEELSALQRESELPLEDLLNAYKLMRGESGSEVEDEEEDDSGETDEDDGSVEGEEASEDGTGAASGEAVVTDESKRSAVFASEGAGAGSSYARGLEQQESLEGGLGSSGGGHGGKTGTVPCARARGPFTERGPSEVAGNLTKLVVELTDGSLEPDGGSSGEVNSPKRLIERTGVLQDDKEYIPAAGNDEDDDERTLEEEDRIAEEEGDENANEIDELMLESEMPLEELLAKYRSDVNDEGEDSDEFSVDRRDRTSEAGTSGSSSEEDDVDGEADDFSDARERMGEPSTSGREREPVLLSGAGISRVINTVEVKREIVETRLVSKPVGASEKMDVQGKVLYSEAHNTGRNGFSGAGSSKSGASSTSLLLGGGGEVDAETAAAVAKVSEAARRRGDRMMRRSANASGGGEVGSKSEVGTILGTGGAKGRRAGDGSLSPRGVSLAVEGDPSRHPADAARFDSMAANGGVGGESENVGDGALVESDVGTEGKAEDGLDVIRGLGPGEGGSADVAGAEAENVEVGEEKNSEERLADFAAAAQSAQPTGYTFSTTKVKTKLPFLLKHSLREYQHIGLDWLVTMYEKRLNGILADEMGLGKTIMTIALLAHLACEKGIWGPHLIVVPTSVMLNWETEFMKWCPAFKILTYFGSAKERKVKRQGWSRANSFHVCITTYRLVIQDAKAFKRKKWKYLILDEAHLIKNWKSQRWQTLLNFNSKRRILLTGTPLQNDLMELWSLMHFLMPHVFQSHQEFRDWFSNPITGMVEGEDQVNKELVDRLHNVLRPFLLRRLKKDVEKQLPGKFEHVIRCRLSKRQRNLYEDFMASSDTQATLSSGNFLGLINVLMQLRKVCNHPDLFEGRPIVSSFDMPGMEVHLSSAACSAMCRSPLEGVDMETLNLQFSGLSGAMSNWEAEEVATIKTPGPVIVELASTGVDTWEQHQSKHKPSREVRSVMEEIHSVLRGERERRRRERVVALWMVNELRCGRQPVYGADFLKSVEVLHPVHDVHRVEGNPRRYLEFSSIVSEMVQLPLTRCERVMDVVTSFMFAIPAARAPLPVAWCSHAIGGGPALRQSISEEVLQEASSMLVPLRPVVVRRQLFFPDRRLLQFDCGKLQELAVLLRRLKSEGHRALIFTQMTKMLDVLESFINLYGYTYMRLDGSTKPEQRQILMQRFNTNPKIFLFILSTRSGGVGINLVGADTVIFYDSDWNPAMDLQAQDRCHRIGQTREVHIYRLISESTIEENILKKANQKRILDDLVIQSGSYNTDFFKKLDPMELFSGLKGVKVGGSAGKGSGATGGAGSGGGTPDAASAKAFEQKELSNAEVEAALKNAEDEADYMAMKRVEQEEAAEHQEFTEEVFAGNLDDEDLADDLDENGRSGRPPSDVAVAGGPAAGGERVAEEGGAVVGTEELPFGESSILATEADEEMDMLADVRQMAAAAAASGRGSGSFEDQLRPVERYAMRFLELWDPRVDNLAVVAQVAFEEKEWELDQLEKLKEEQEAEIDEDNEPLFYETWDTALADEAYRQQVDILAQQQEQKQLEWEAMEEEMRDADRALAEAAATVRGAENFTLKSKGKKKSKKAKFKSLAEGSLVSDTEDNSVGEDYHAEAGGDPSYGDEQSEMMHLPHRSLSQRKRKAPKLLEEEMSADKQSKKVKKDQSVREKGTGADKGKGRARTFEDSLFRTIFGISSDHKQSGGGRQDGDGTGGGSSSGGGHGGGASSGKEKLGKLSISGTVAKKGPLVMLEKERKKDSVRSVEQLPPASPWTHGEDAVLCAVVHEYGGNWHLASDALAGGPDGGVYRGRHRHPIHCRERFRQLLAQNVAAASGDPTSEKSAQNAATNAQLRVTEEHTKRLLDAVLQLPEQELLLQRHFVAALAAVQNWAKVGPQLESERVGGGGAADSPCGGRTFISLKSLVKPQAAASKIGGGKLSPREVSAALVQAERENKSVSNQATVKPHAKGLVPKHAGVAGENEGFSVAQFLVGSPVQGESGAGEGGSGLQAQSVASAVTLEDLLGFTPPSPAAGVSVKAVRHLAEMLVGNRFRFASKIGWDGAIRDWAAAGGSGTGVLGLHIPSKGRGVPKKRPAGDPSRPPKAKAAKTSKSDAKKGPADATGEEAGPPSGANGQDSSVPGGRDAESNGKGAVAGAEWVRKAGVKKPKKKAPNSAASTSPPGSGGLDLNVQQPGSPARGERSSKSGKKGSPGVRTPGAPKPGQRTEKKEKSVKKVASQSGQATDSEAGSGRRAGSGNPASVGRDLNGGSSREGSLGARGIDLNGSSDDDVTIVGVSPGNRFDGFESPVAAPARKPKIYRHATKRSEAAGSAEPNLAEYGGDVEELGFPALRSSGAGFGALHGEDSSLASHLMSRLSGSSGPDLLSLGVPEQLHWPPAAGAWPPVPSLNDLDFSAELPSLPFSEGKQRPSGAGSPVRGSPPGREAGRSVGRGSSPSLARSQTSGRSSRAGHVQENGGQGPAWMLERQPRGAPSSERQGAGRSSVAGGSDLSRAVLRLGPSSPVRGASVSGASASQQHHQRPHASPGRSMAGASLSGRRTPSLGPQMYQPGAFPDRASGPESPVDTGLALSLGSGAHKKQAGPRAARDVQPHPSSGR